MNLMEKYKKKVNAPEAIRWDTLSHIHLSTARQLAAEGVNFRLTSPEIAQAEDSLNEIWISCLHGRSPLVDFEAINRLWAETIRSVNKKKGA